MMQRRTFLMTLAPAGVLVCGTGLAQPAKLDEKDPQAVALGYVEDATKADKAKFPKYAAGQTCASCQLYQGKAGDASGPCAIFAGKHVAAKGWCSAYMKKA